MELRDGTTAGVGDLIMTRRNHRDLTDTHGRRFVHNGDTWTITEHHHDGSLTVTGALGTGHTAGTVRLPHDYVRVHVELGYATTTASAQGRTVDSTHALVDGTVTRASLYVAATRARQNNQLYVVTEHNLALDAEHPPAPDIDAHDLLARAITTDPPEQTATEVRRRGRTATGRLAVLPAKDDRAPTASGRGPTV